MSYNIIRDMLDGWSEQRWCPRGLGDIIEIDGESVTTKCIITRMVEVRPVARDINDARAAIGTVIFENYPDRVTQQHVDNIEIGHFNDHPDTTWEDVVTVLEKAAVKLDEDVF